MYTRFFVLIVAWDHGKYQNYKKEMCEFRTFFIFSSVDFLNLHASSLAKTLWKTQASDEFGSGATSA